MRLLLLAFLVCLPSLANAQFRIEYPVVCDSTEKVIKSLEGNFKEKLTWTGKHVNDNSVYSLWVEEKTETWTLLKMTPEFSCILGVGTDAKLILGTSI